jgi:hypothetical protein
MNSLDGGACQDGSVSLVGGTTAQTRLVLAEFGIPKRQNRWTVALRLVFALPHVILLVLGGIGADVRVILGWYCALVIGRLPTGFGNFVESYLSYQLRVSSYLWLMNQDYPTVSGSRSFPVSVDIPRTRARRLAVLFRIILLIPGWVVCSLVSAGMSIAGVFIWLIALVRGRMPAALFGAVAAVLRFQIRFAPIAPRTEPPLLRCMEH